MGSEFIKTFFYVIFEFLCEFYIIFFLVNLKLKKAEKYLLKEIGGIVIVFALSFGISFFYYYFGNTVWGRIITYAVLFALITAQAYFSHKESLKTILFCSSLTYAIQNLIYKSFLVVLCALEQGRVLDAPWRYYSLIYRVLFYSMYFGILAIIYFYYIKKVQKKMGTYVLNNKLLIGSMVILGLTVILCSFEDIYFSDLCFERENRFNDVSFFILREAGNVFSISSCAIVLTLINKTLEQDELKRELQYLQYAVKQSELQYQISKDTIDMINIKCHDIKYKIQNALEGNSEINESVVNDLKDTISIYDTKVETNNKLLDVILTEKSLFCEQNNIRFSCMADASRLSFISDGDLYCLFGNIIDNALEAVKDIEETNRRVINLVIKTKNNFLIIQEDNYYDGKIEFENGFPLTTKKDKNYHGFGVKSISMITSKYNGTMTSSVTGDIFHMNIVFSLENESNDAN